MFVAGRRSDGRRAVIHTGVFMPAQVRELRRKAVLCRRAASVPTSGSGNADRILLALAEQLERDAALRERQLQKDVSDRPRDRQEPGRPLTEITNTEA
jgi:hypothetical protein